MILTTVASIGLMSSNALAQSNIDATNKHAWGENVGWTNWRDANGAAQGVVVSGTFMGGFIWGENVGWINVGDGSPANGVNYANTDGIDFGINIDPDGDLHGLAWGENIGWVNFDGGALANPPQPARIECADPPTETLSRLTGYVWGENVGWINLDDTAHYVSVDAATTPIECDLNHDGVLDGLDIGLFVDFLLATGQPDWRDICSGDVEVAPNHVIDVDDVEEFVTCLLNK
jgi:hypothetical protein